MKPTGHTGQEAVRQDIPVNHPRSCRRAEPLEFDERGPEEKGHSGPLFIGQKSQSNASQSQVLPLIKESDI